MKSTLTRLALGITLGAGLLGSTLAAAAPASAQPDWHNGYHDQNHGGRYWNAREHRYEQYREWQRDRGQRYYDRQHGYWRDRLGYWNPRSGVYVSFHF